MPDYTLYYWPAPFRGQFVRAVLAHVHATWDKATEDLRVAEADLSRAEAALNEAEKQVIAAEKTLGCAWRRRVRPSSPLRSTV